MATLLDVGLLQNFSGIFTFLLVWVVTFGVLEYTNPMGDDKQGLHALISVVLSFFVLFSGQARALFEFIVPWATVLALAAFFLIFTMVAFGNDVSDVHEWADGGLKTWVSILFVVILLFGLGGVFSGSNQDQQNQQYVPPQDNTTQSGLSGQQEGYQGQTTQQESEEGFSDIIASVFTNPQFLGALFLLLLASFTVGNLSKTN